MQRSGARGSAGLCPLSATEQTASTLRAGLTQASEQPSPEGPPTFCLPGCLEPAWSHPYIQGLLELPWPVPSWVQKAGPLQTQVGSRFILNVHQGDAVGPPWALMPTSSPTPESLSAQAGLGDSSSSDCGAASYRLLLGQVTQPLPHVDVMTLDTSWVVTQTLMSWGVTSCLPRNPHYTWPLRPSHSAPLGLWSRPLSPS